MIEYTYSAHYPKIQRLQGGILVPVNIEQVKVPGFDGPETQYRYQLLKFEDHGEDISDETAFRERYKDIIAKYLADGVDVHRDGAKVKGWSEKVGPADVVPAHVDLRQNVAKEVPIRRREKQDLS